MNRGQGVDILTRNLNSLAAFEGRLSGMRSTRLGESMAVLAEHLHDLLVKLRPTEAEMRAVIAFLTETGHHTDARRQEWVLLADALGISAAVQDLAAATTDRGTPSTAGGPFYRPDMPNIERGQSICLDGRGEAMVVSGLVRSTHGGAVGGAVVEVWHANGEGFYENQEPDLQPEHNLRGRLTADRDGSFCFASIKPGGYRLPADGPVGRLLTQLGLSLDRPAHVNFRVTAAGFRPLTTQIFDRDDPAIDRDAIFGVRPELLADFLAETSSDGGRTHRLKIELVMAPEEPSQTMPGRSSE